MPNDTQEATQQATNDTQTVQPEQSGQTVPQVSEQEQPASQVTEPKQETKVEASPKRSHNDRIAELESKIARMEAIYQLQGQNVVDMEVCTDLLLKGYTIDQLKQSKPYLFNQSSVAVQGVVRQPPKVVAETQTPKAPASNTVSSDGFVKSLANMLISKF